MYEEEAIQNRLKSCELKKNLTVMLKYQVLEPKILEGEELQQCEETMVPFSLSM